MTSRELALCDLSTEMRQLRKQAETVSLRETTLPPEAMGAFSSAIALLATEITLLRKDINELKERFGR